MVTALVRRWKKFHARTCTPSGATLYEIGRTDKGRPVLVVASEWRLAQNDPDHRRRLIRQSSEVLGEEDRCPH